MRYSTRDIPIPPTVQEQPEVEAQAAAAGQEYKYPDVEDCGVYSTSKIMGARQPVPEDRSTEGYGRPRSAPSSDHTGLPPREGHGRPLSAGGAARRLQAAMKRKMIKEGDNSKGEKLDQPHEANDETSVEVHGDYFQQYPPSGSRPNSPTRFNYDRYSRYRGQDLQIEDYFSDFSSSASEEDEILYDASIEDPDRVKHFLGFINVDGNFEAELEGEREKSENELGNQDDTKVNSLGRKDYFPVKYKTRQRLSVDFTSKKVDGSKELLYTEGTAIDRSDNLTCHRKGNEETTSVYLHKPVKSIFTADNIRENVVRSTTHLNSTYKQDRSKSNNKQTEDSNLQIGNLTESEERLMSGKQIDDTIPLVLGKSILARSKLAPSKFGRESASQTTVSESRTPITILALANQPSEKGNEEMNSLVSIGGTSSLSPKKPKRKIGVLTIMDKNTLKSSQGEDPSLSKALISNQEGENYKKCMAVSKSLAHSLEKGKMKFRLVANQVKKNKGTMR